MARLRITFVLPAVGIAGGTKVVFQYANHLLDVGHDVRILYPGVLNPPSRIGWRAEALLRQLKYAVAARAARSEAHRWFPLRAPVRHTPSLESQYMPPADYLIATAVETAEWVVSAPTDRGKKVYFIQDVESWSVGEPAALASWELPFDGRFVVSSSLAKIAMRQEVAVDAIVTNGVDVSQFYWENKVLGAPPSVLMLSHLHERKGVADGFAAMRLVWKKAPEVRLRMFGAYAPLAEMPPNTEYHQVPNPEELRRIYGTSDIYLSCSRREGFGLPAMEAMACGCALVGTATGGIPELTRDGELGLVVQPGDVQGMADAILRLVGDPVQLEHLGQAGQKYIHQEFTLAKASQRFAKQLLAV